MDKIANEIDLDAFEDNYRGAKAYHNRAEQFLEEGQSASVVFNVASVALERYLVALCDLHGAEPRNHNYTCLMDEVEEIMIVPPALNEKIRALDVIFNICFLEDYYHGETDETDSDRVLALCNEVAELFDQSKISAVRTAFKNQGKMGPI